MTKSDSTRQAGFSEELSQLVKKHINAGADPAAIADALALQAEVASSKAPGSDIDGSPTRESSAWDLSTMDHPAGHRYGGPE